MRLCDIRRRMEVCDEDEDATGDGEGGVEVTNCEIIAV
jgi:hypothetical protein